VLPTSVSIDPLGTPIQAPKSRPFASSLLSCPALSKQTRDEQQRAPRPRLSAQTTSPTPQCRRRTRDAAAAAAAT